MNKQIEEGNTMLDELNINIDQTTKQTKKANDLLEGYLNSASNCCLYTYIGVALFIFLVLVSI